MKTFLLLTLRAVITTAALLVCTAVTTDSMPPVPTPGFVPTKKTMKAFRSEKELAGYFRKHAQARPRAGTLDSMVAAEPNAAGPTGLFTVYDGANFAESITNVQHAGVDEGGIVKVHGDHLVVLRRGRLFTVAIGDAALEPISAVDAFGPDMNPSSTW